ncbi:major capsid protein [Agrobacterium vitis]|uniref:major capsid protein n=1 Tax=Agrobacterium vitis TaxID=373 RepID=UPI0015747523|nr:major capsid protein [Agrobacterium vitis]NSY21895.1 major capsid protein [Agrobacterium vitis]WEO73185.1 major capsid protein [Agrobacterium vitis]
MASMDIFRDDAFSMVELSAAVKEVEYVPQLLGSLGIFEEKGVYVRKIAVEKKGDTLSLIPTSPDGAPPRQSTPTTGNIRDFRSVRLADGFTLYASEVAGFRAFGTESELKVVQTEYAERMADVRTNMDLTHEYHRLGALQGKLLDANGTSVIYDYFDEFDIAEPAAIDLALDVDTTDVRGKCHELTRSMARSAKGAFTTATSVHALTGDEFYDTLVNHPKVIRTYENWAAAADLRQNIAFQAFTFGGVTWHNYRGTDDNSTVAIPTDEASIFPVGASNVFKKFVSPADEFMPFVNTKGQDVYAMNIVDKDREAWAKGELYSYPLYMCVQPQVLRRATL